MSLADELLADLENLDEEELMQEEIVVVQSSINNSDIKVEDLKSANIHELATLSRSDRLNNVMKNIEQLKNGMPENRIHVNGPVEADPEYMLIVEANNLAVEIDNEISIIHKFVRDVYSKRFPELDSLVVGSLEYVSTVKELKNDLDQAKNNENLQQFLTQATIMVVSVTASTTQGQLLTEEELAEVIVACNMAIDLNADKQKVYEFVESRMAFIAPNLSIIVGASTAAKLMGIAGGLANLSKIPACNILVLGSQKKTLSGFSQSSVLPHTGFIYTSSIVQDMPPDLRGKAARLVAGKCTLAIRVDANHGNPDGAVGKRLREEILKKFDKLTEPPPVKFVKPLPKPVDPPRKKRGGKKVRKVKERYAITEMRKQANRLNFADIEDDAYQEDLGYTRGTIGKAGTGRIRTAQVDEKTKESMAKIEKFVLKDCCKMNCNKRLSLSDINELRMECLDLDYNEKGSNNLDIAILAVLRTIGVYKGPTTHAGVRSNAVRQRATLKYMVHGEVVCRTMFLFCYTISHSRLERLVNLYKTEGLVEKLHGNCK